MVGELTITLDKRILRTPEGNLISIPASKRALASIVAQEWEAQDKVMKHYALPVVGAPFYFSLVCVWSVLSEYFPTDVARMQSLGCVSG